MRAAWAVARRELRARWRSLLALALLIGVAGGVVIAAAAGASRTSSAFTRFVAVNPFPEAAVMTAPDQVDDVLALPGVTNHALLQPIGVQLADPEHFLQFAASSDGRVGVETAIPRVIEGRLPSLDQPYEISLSEQQSEQLVLDVGDAMPILTYTPEDIQAMQSGQQAAPTGPELELDVVGITRTPPDLSAPEDDPGLVVLTPAFYEQYHDQLGTYVQGTVVMVDLEGGPDAVPAFKDELGGIESNGQAPPPQLLVGAVLTTPIENAISVLTTALVLFAVALGVAALVAGTLTASRSTWSAATEHDPLRAMGMSTGGRVAALVAPRGVAALLGAVVAGIVAVVLSPRFPIGVARQAEPNPGVQINVAVLALGLAVLVVITVLVATASGWVVTRTLTRPSPITTRPSWTSRLTTAPAMPVATGVGLRMALRRGRGRTAVPVWSAMGGVALAVAGVVAAATFGSSLTRFIDSPDRWGWDWDLGFSDISGDPGGQAILDDPSLDALSHVDVVQIVVDGQPTYGYGFESVQGSIEPPIVEGRAPAAPDEIALGQDVLDALDLQIGDTTEVDSPDGPRSFRIVGRALFAALGDPVPVSHGALLTREGIASVDNPDDQEGYPYLVATWDSAAHRDQARREIEAIAEETNGPRPPGEVDRLEQVRRLPALLAGFLALLGIAAVGFTLTASIRRRRRDLAVCKVLGFRRRSVRAAIAWQTATWTVIGAAIGVPLGLVVGREAWTIVADSLGVATDASVPVAVVAGGLLASLVTLELISWWPAWRAGRTGAAEVLRSE